MNPELTPMGLAAQMACECNGQDTCAPCKVREAAAHLEKVWHDDTKRAQAVHDLIHAVKEAAK